MLKYLIQWAQCCISFWFIRVMFSVGNIFLCFPTFFRVAYLLKHNVELMHNYWSIFASHHLKNWQGVGTASCCNWKTSDTILWDEFDHAWYSCSCFYVLILILVLKDDRKIRYVFMFVKTAQHLKEFLSCSALLVYVTLRLQLLLITRLMGPTWGPSGAERTQVGPMLAPWFLLSGLIPKFTTVTNKWWFCYGPMPVLLNSHIHHFLF